MSEYNPLDLKGQQKTKDNKKSVERIDRQNEESDIKWLMSSKRGRRLVWRLLEQAGVFRSSFNTNAMAMSFAEGNRNYGLQLLNLVHTLCPELYPTMIKEQKMSEMLMTEANQSNEGDTQQPVDAQTEATTDTQQQAEGVQDQQVSDETPVESETSESETPEGAPEKYEFSNKVADAPDELDPEVLTEFGDVAKELNLPQEAAQKVLDKVAPVIQARQAKAIEQTKVEWANQSKSDEEFGGESLTENLDVAKASLDTFGTDALKSLLQETGLGNHPEVIRFMYRAGKAISEDSYVGNSEGANPSGSRIPKDFNGIANALYSNQQTK